MINLDDMTIEQVTILVVGILLLISFITAIISLILETDRTRQWYGDWFQGVSTEMVGAAMTTIFFTFIVGAVEQRQESLALQTELIQQMGSIVNGEALRAVEELRDNGWLRDGTLNEGEFYSANLASAQLFGAELTETIFFDANFENANLEGSNLSNANLQGTSLTGANLQAAILQNADLNAANLEGANLSGADLRGVNLADANLRNSILDNVTMDENTVLPDAEFDSGTGMYRANWQPDRDLSRYTTESHSDFWQPVPPYPWWYSDENP